MFHVSEAQLSLEPVDETSQEYQTNEPIPVLFTNQTESTLFLPLCGGMPPAPTYQRLDDGTWKDAIHLARPAVGCTESLAVEPGEEYDYTHRLVFPLVPGALPLDGESPEIEDVYDRYRMKFEVYSAGWSGGPRPEEVPILLEADRVSNAFELIPSE